MEIAILQSVSERQGAESVRQFCLKLVAVARSLAESEKDDQILELRSNIYHLVKKS